MEENQMKIYDYRHEVPENAVFMRSDATGQIYALDELPKFVGGFAMVSRAEYDTYVKEHLLR